MDEQDRLLRDKAKRSVADRRYYYLCRVMPGGDSVVICPAVPEKAMGVHIGFLVFGFWGICVAIHAVCALLVRKKLLGPKKAHPYETAVQRE